MSGVDWEGVIPTPRFTQVSGFPLELGSSLGKTLSIDLRITFNPISLSQGSAPPGDPILSWEILLASFPERTPLYHVWVDQGGHFHRNPIPCLSVQFFKDPSANHCMQMTGRPACLQVWRSSIPYGPQSRTKCWLLPWCWTPAGSGAADPPLADRGSLPSFS